MSTFATLHSQLRGLEAHCARLLSQYAVQAQDPSSDTTLGGEIEANLGTRREHVDEMFQFVHEPGCTPTMRHQAQRHREVLEEHSSTVKRLGDSYTQERDRHNLLSSVRSEIENHRTQSPANADRYLYDERSRVESSNTMADRLLAQAYEARADFANQQAMLANVQRRIWQSFSRVPGINSLISKVNSRQRRNSLVLAAVITLCIVFIVALH